MQILYHILLYFYTDFLFSSLAFKILSNYQNRLHLFKALLEDYTNYYQDQM